THRSEVVGVILSFQKPLEVLQAAQPMCLVSVTLGSFSFFLLCLLQLLSQFISPYTGRIYGRHITGLCGRKQKEISKAIKKAQKLGFMSVTHKHPQLMRDPNICNIKYLR
uniref:Mitochondrial ribosomal protein S18C n=1 Tax=Cynoglossus semilaevis TaxID=244447 RepID=A0A3P8UL64_CYNSE